LALETNPTGTVTIWVLGLDGSSAAIREIKRRTRRERRTRESVERRISDRAGYGLHQRALQCSDQRTCERSWCSYPPLVWIQRAAKSRSQGSTTVQNRLFSSITESKKEQPVPPVLRFAVVYRAIEPILGPQVFGGMIRGALGKALMDINPTAYNKLLRPEPRTELQQQFKNPPPPLYLETALPAGGLVQSGSSFTVTISLVGEVAILSEIVLAGLEKAGQVGFGKTQSRAELINAECIWRNEGGGGLHPSGAHPETPAIPECPDAARIVLTSALRKKERGQFLGKNSFTARAWIEAVQARIGLLDVAYGDAASLADLPDVPRCKISQVQLWDVLQKHHSSAQETKAGKGDLDASGVTGNFLLPMQGLEENWPYIWAGQWYQVGARPNIGLGAYRVLPE